MKLIDHITENQINWTFQIFQNVLSMCGMIPLRLYDLNRVDREWKNFYERMGNFDISRLDENPLKVWNELVKRTGKKPENLDVSKQETPWLTLHSYPLPLWAEAMKVEKLLACKTAYMYHWLKGLEKNAKKKDYRLIIKKLLMIGCKKLDLPGKELYLIIGPVLRYPEKRQTGEAVFKEILEPLISHFEEWTKDSADDLSQPERVRMMDIQGSLRPFLDKRNLEDRLKKAANSFERLLLCQWPQGEILQRCICRELARDNWVLHTTTVNEILDKWIREKHKKIFSFEKMSITFPIQAHKSSLAKHNCYLLKALFKDKVWHLEIIPVQEKYKISSPKIEWIERGKKSSFKEGHLNLIKKKLLNRFKESGNKKGKEALFPDGVEDDLVYFWHWNDKIIDSMEISYAQERLIFFEQLFRQEFGLLAANIEEKKPLEAIFMKISREIAQLLTADQCDIYRYNNEKEILEIVGYYPSNDKNIDPTRKDMCKIGGNKEMRKRSILYRTLDDKHPHFCRAAIEKNGNFVFEPESEEILTNPVFIVRSLISIPLMVFGRIFGVLQISGFSPLQFTWENRQLLRRISEFISPLVYETLIFHYIADLTKTVLKFEIKEKDKYRQICEKMRELFMAYAAVLWQPDRENINHYVPIGWTLNRSDFFKLDELKEKAFFNMKDPDCLYNLAIKAKDGKPPFTINIEDKLRDEKWYRNKLHREWLREEKIKEVTHLTISLPYGDTLVLTLYYRVEKEGLNKPWLRVIDFISYHTALLLEALMSQKKWEQGVRNIIHHELKQKVGVILNRTEDIYKFLWKHAARDIRQIYMGVPGARSKFDLVFQDIKSYSASLSNLLDILQDPETFETLKRSHSHPLHFIAIKQKQSFESHAKKSYVNLKQMFNEVFMNTWEIRTNRDLKYTYDGPEQGPFLFMERDHLRTVLNNLVDNAVKYAIPGTYINAKVSISDYSLEFWLSNFAEPIEAYEEYSIFNENVRGVNAVDKSGQGQGLYLARLCCEIYEGELALKIDRRGNYPLFTFLIALPKKILKKTGETEEEI